MEEERWRTSPTESNPLSASLLSHPHHFSSSFVLLMFLDRPLSQSQTIKVTKLRRRLSRSGSALADELFSPAPSADDLSTSLFPPSRFHWILVIDIELCPFLWARVEVTSFSPRIPDFHDLIVVFEQHSPILVVIAWPRVSFTIPTRPSWSSFVIITDFLRSSIDAAYVVSFFYEGYHLTSIWC